eukprot:EST43962.1 YbaK/prolyl-tRNA synthetases associated domain-containing protein [Spironucleus salmonicida]
MEKLCEYLQIQNDDDVINCLAQAYRHKLKSVYAIKVHDHYYNLELQERPNFIGSYCKNTNQLTKAIIYENRFAPIDLFDVEFSRYYILIFQYSRKFSMTKFNQFVKNEARKSQLYKLNTKSNYKWQFADEHIAKDLTGADHNGMSFIGLKNLQIPIIIDQSIEEEYIFVGGLHPLVKARLVVQQIIDSFKTYTVDITTQNE